MTLQQAGFQRDLLSWELGVSSPCPRSAGQHKAMSHTWLSSTSVALQHQQEVPSAGPAPDVQGGEQQGSLVNSF